MSLTHRKSKLFYALARGEDSWHGSRLSALGSRLTAHGSRLTAHGSRLTAHGSWLTAHGSRLSFAVGLLPALLCALAYPHEALAQSCLTNTSGGPLDSAANTIYVYVEHDIHEEMRGYSTTTTLDDALTHHQVVQTIMGAAEIWNQQTRAVSFVYAGPTDADSASDFCNSSPSRTPALFLHLHNGDASTGATYSGSVFGCETEPLGQIYLHKGGANGIGNGYWPLGSHGDTTISHLTHEFGHAVGLGEIGAGNCSTHKNALSVMNGCTSAPNIRCAQCNGRVHPLNWDKDCADSMDINTSGKSLKYKWVGWTPSGVQGETETDSRTTARAGLGTNWVRTTVGAFRYSAYLDSAVIGSSILGTNGYLEFSTYSMDTGELTDVGNLDVAPFLFSVHEFGVPGEAMRINFTDDENDGSPSTKYNPPYTQYIQTNATLSGAAGADASYYRCANPPTCSMSTAIRSHLPLVTTFDPVQAVTVLGWVQTDSDGGDSQGDLWLHAGFHSSTMLNAGNVLDPASEIGLPATGTSWSWMGRTHHTPAIACADSTSDWGGYNCLLAWNDRGLGALSGETVLLKFFRVSASGKAIELKSGNAEVRTTSNTATAPALAFFNDKLWLAFKTTFATPSVYLYTRANAASGWASGGAFDASEAVGPPTWHYGYGTNYVETGLFWTVAE